jgi:hypothetical protein
MHNLAKLACAALIVTPAITFAAEVHPEVKKAFDYSIPELNCKKPKLPGALKDVVDPLTGAVNRADVDSYKLGRYDRAEKRWLTCLTKYKQGLMQDFEELRNSASHGLTQTQAKAIMSNMKGIQRVIESPIGNPEASMP